VGEVIGTGRNQPPVLSRWTVSLHYPRDENEAFKRRVLPSYGGWDALSETFLAHGRKCAQMPFQRPSMAPTSNNGIRTQVKKLSTLINKPRMPLSSHMTKF